MKEPGRSTTRNIILINVKKPAGVCWFFVIAFKIIKLIDETKHDDTLTEALKQDEISHYFLGYTKNEVDKKKLRNKK